MPWRATPVAAGEIDMNQNIHGGGSAQANTQGTESIGELDGTRSPAQRSRQTKSQLYFVGDRGHIYCYSAYPTTPIAPLSTVLLISVDGTPITTKLNGVTYRAAAHIAGPAWTEIHSGDARVMAFVFYGFSALQRAVRALPAPHVLPMQRSVFAELDPLLLAAAYGELNSAEAVTLYDDVAAIVATHLPAASPPDARIETVLKMLTADPQCTLPTLAAAVSLSPDRLTHLFSDLMGINLRRQRLAVKLRHAIQALRQGTTLTEAAQIAGFSDSAHLSRAFKEINGAPPSFYLGNTNIRQD